MEYTVATQTQTKSNECVQISALHNIMITSSRHTHTNTTPTHTYTYLGDITVSTVYHREVSEVHAQIWNHALYTSGIFTLDRKRAGIYKHSLKSTHTSNSTSTS